MRPAVAAVLLAALVGPAPAQEVKYLGTDEFTGGSVGTVVGNVPLVHTTQFLPLQPDGTILGKGNAGEQADAVMNYVRAAVVSAGGDGNRVVRLNVGVADGALVGPVRKVIEKWYPAGRRPAVTFVVGKLPHPDALVAMDGVAPVKGTVGAVRYERGMKEAPLPGEAHAAVLPAGPRVYVSGQAEKGDTPAEATRKTLAGLRTTLKWLGLDDGHVVQCKAFLKPMTAENDVTKEFVAHFGARKCPPLVFVEWDSTLPIEIELIAAAPGAKKAADPVEYLTPPGMTASPVYCRVARVTADRFLYTGGLVSAKAGTGEEQVAGTFERLQGVLKDAGSDFNHLVKATYYVSDEDAGGALNKLRPKYYDPKRPPAASKAKVAGTGVKERSLILDLIAVPAK